MTANLATASELAHRRHALEATLQPIARELCDEYPPETYIRWFDDDMEYRVMRYVPPQAMSCCLDITARWGRRALETYHKLVIVHLIEQFGQRQERHHIPESVRELLFETFAKIISAFDKAKEGYYIHENELFVRDFGMCRLKLLPCGSEVVDVCSGIPRRMLFLGGVSQFISGCSFVAVKLRGFKPLYESHWNRRLILQFTPGHYDRFYLRVADLLRANPRMKGLLSSSWWLDPQLESISPELSFLRTTPENNGARLFIVGPDPDSTDDAIRFSEARTELYEAGKYQPTCYSLVWARDDLIQWADRFTG